MPGSPVDGRCQGAWSARPAVTRWAPAREPSRSARADVPHPRGCATAGRPYRPDRWPSAPRPLRRRRRHRRTQSCAGSARAAPRRARRCPGRSPRAGRPSPPAAPPRVATSGARRDAELFELVPIRDATRPEGSAEGGPIGQAQRQQNLGRALVERDCPLRRRVDHHLPAAILKGQWVSGSSRANLDQTGLGTPRQQHRTYHAREQPGQSAHRARSNDLKPAASFSIASITRIAGYSSSPVSTT